MPKQANANEERNIRQVLKENAMTLVWVVGVVFSFIMFVVIPQQETKTSIALIQQSITTIEKNHLTHLEGYAKIISEVQVQQANLENRQLTSEEKNQKEHMEMMKTLERAITLIENAN